MKIYNVLAKNVFARDYQLASDIAYRERLDFGGFPAGTYVCVLELANGVKRVMKLTVLKSGDLREYYKYSNAKIIYPKPYELLLPAYLTESVFR